MNRAKDYYKNNKEVLGDQARNKYRELPEEEKNMKREYAKKEEKKRYDNMPEENKQKLKEYQKNYRETKKPEKKS